MLSDRAGQEPILTKKELLRVNKVIQWSQKHEKCMYFGSFVTVPRLMEFVYEIHPVEARSRLIADSTRILVNQSPPTANTQGATPRKDKGKVQAAHKGKSTIMDMGKGKMIEPEKTKKPEFIPLQTSGAFKIYMPKNSAPPTPPAIELTKKSPTAKRKPIEMPP